MLREVPPKGPQPADILLVGEAPGADEVREGKPFVGYAGRTLNRWLATAGISRLTCRITNVVLVRPPGNKYERLEELGVSESDYIPRLVEEIRATKPKVIVALGNNPMRVLTGNTGGITKRRGSFYPCTLVPEIGAPVLVTLHPAARILHSQPELSHVCAFDLSKAKRVASGEAPSDLHYQVLLNPSFEAAMEWLEVAPDPLTIDIEFIRGRVACIGLGNSRSVLVLPITHASGEPFWTEEHEVQLWLKLQELWHSRRLIGQNFTFDITMIEKWLGLPPKFYFDTMVAHAALYPGWRHGLDFLTSIYTPLPYYKEEIKSWTGSITNESLWEYNSKDVVATHLCYEGLLAELQEEGLSKFYFGHYHRELMPYLEMSLRGVRVDLERKRELSKSYAVRIEEGEALLEELVGRKINVGSSKQVSELLYNELGVRGKGTTDRKQLKRLAARYAGTPVGAVVQAIQSLRSLRKVKESYLDAPTSEDGRWRTNYSVTATLSGRLGSRKWLDGSGVNLQTLSPEMRTLVVPDPGMVLLECDLSQAEARVVAWEAEDETLMEFFLSGQDVHSLVAKELGVSRKHAKATVHGSNYGMGPIAFSEHVGLPVREGKQLQEAYYQRFPGIRRRMLDIQRRVRRRETFRNPFGRIIKPWGAINDSTFRSFYSWFPQSTVGDIIHRAVQELWREPRITLLLNVHDSIVIECLPEHLDYVKERLVSAMTVPLEIRGRELIIPADLEVFEERWEKR